MLSLSLPYFRKSSRSVVANGALTFTLGCLVSLAAAQQPGSGTSSSQDANASSSTSGSGAATRDLNLPSQRPAPPPAAIDPAGPAVSLETSEPLFDVAVALNTCGYDTGLEQSDPVRIAIREQVNRALTQSAAARDARDSLCTFIREHRLSDAGRDLAQYISLAMYLTPPPALAPSADETDMPPDSTQVLGMLPMLRSFAAAIQLHVLWVEHKPDYEDLTTRVHDPLTRVILETNVYLKQPTSTYDGRRFLVLLEPMLAPGQTNARIYANDYIVIASPVRKTGVDTVKMGDIRHTYLHYEIEPLVYARASSTERLLPILKSVREANAPLDFTYRTDIVALMTESLIRAIEARTLDIRAATGLRPPTRPSAVKQRADLEKYDAEEAAYQRQAEVARRQTVDRDMRQGYVLTQYFYGELAQLEHEPESLKEHMGEMIYSMDVDHERRQAERIAYFPEGSSDVVSRVPRQLHGLDLAEMKLIKGDAAGAVELAQKALADKSGDPARADYILARVESAHGDMAKAIDDFQQTIKLSKDPRTLAWSHIYLGRIYDIRDERPTAIAEYKAALTVRDSQPDTKSAAEKGIKQQYQSPRQLQQARTDGSTDTTGGKSGNAGSDTKPVATPTTGSSAPATAAPKVEDKDAPVEMVPRDNTPLPPPLPAAKPKKKKN